jgi:competence protein ComEC
MRWVRTPLVPLAGAFATGVAAAALVPSPLAWAVWLGAVGAALILLVLQRPAWVAAAIFAGVAALGTLRAAPVPSPVDDLARLAFPREARVDGRIVAEPVRLAPERQRVLLEVSAVDGVPRTGRVQLTVYGPGVDLRDGQRITAVARLRRARGFRNPGGFDYAAFLARDDIHVLGAAHGRAVTVVDATTPWRVEMRRRALAAMERSLPPVSAALLGGLLIGARGDLPPDILDGFRRAGVYHVLAVSGFNVALIASAVFATALIARAARRTAAVAAIVVVLGFAAVVGTEPSVLRAAIMAVLVLAALLLDRDASVVNSLALAALVILAARPADLHDPGFQLSFAATLGIVLAPVPRGYVAGAIGVSLAAQLAVLPITTAHFNQVSTIGIVANLAVVPLAGLATVLGLAAVAVSGVSDTVAGAMFDSTWPILVLLRGVVRLAAGVPGALVHLPAPSWTAIVAYTVGLASALLAWIERQDRPVLSRIAGACAFWLLLGAGVAAAWPMVRPPGDRLRVTVLDVGRGQAIVVERPHRGTAVVLTGTRQETADRVVAPYLWNRGVRELAAVIATDDARDAADRLRRLFAVREPARTLVDVITDARGAAAAVTVEHGVASFVFVLDADIVASRGRRDPTVLVLDPAADAAPRLLSERAATSITVFSVAGRDRERRGPVEGRAHLTAPRGPSYRTDDDGALVMETDGRRLHVTRWATGAVDRHCLDPESPGC